MWKLWSIDLLKLNKLPLYHGNNTLTPQSRIKGPTCVGILCECTKLIVMGLMFLQAMQIYRHRSVMRQDDTTSRQDDRTNRQGDRPSGPDHIMANRQDSRTSRQGDIENRHRVIFYPYTVLQISSIHAYNTRSSSKSNMYSCTSKNLILKKDKLSQFFIKIMEWGTRYTERYNVWKKKGLNKNLSVCSLKY